MTKVVENLEATIATLMPSPNSFGLPLLDKGKRARSETLALVEIKWPTVLSLVQEERVPEAIKVMEGLAKEMRGRTNADAEPWKETLLMSRLVLYDNILNLARSKNCLELAQESLRNASRWDAEAREHIGRLLRRG